MDMVLSESTFSYVGMEVVYK